MDRLLFSTTKKLICLLQLNQGYFCHLHVEGHSHSKEHLNGYLFILYYILVTYSQNIHIIICIIIYIYTHYNIHLNEFI